MREIIVAQGLTPSPSDQAQIVALVDGIDLGRTPKEASADSGYLSEANLEALADRSIAAYIATGRAKHPTEAKRKLAGPLTRAMLGKLKRAGWRSRYRLRKQIPPSRGRHRCSDRSNRHEASASSCCAASRTCAPSGR